MALSREEHNARRAMAPSSREPLRNTALSAVSSAKIRPIRLGGIVPPPFIRERCKAGLFERFVANSHSEFQQRDARASGAMRIASQGQRATHMRPRQLRPPVLSRLPAAIKASPIRIAHSSSELSPR